MSYEISKYTMDRARLHNLEVKPSIHKNKKLDVYKNGQFIMSIGDSRYADYPTYLKRYGQEYAESRRRLYHIRHPKNTIGEKLSKLLLW